MDSQGNKHGIRSTSSLEFAITGIFTSIKKSLQYVSMHRHRSILADLVFRISATECFYYITLVIAFVAINVVDLAGLFHFSMTEECKKTWQAGVVPCRRFT